MKIIINTHHCTREELAELKEYLEDKSWDFKIDETIKEEILYVLGDDTINGVVLNEKIEADDLFEYKITHRESFIDKLTRWIGEATKDKELMKEDLKMLLNVTDEYIFSSNSTNSYLYQGCSEFNKTCEELLELDNSLNN